MSAYVAGGVGSSAPAPVKENTQLESHLYDLRSLHEELAKAGDRARRLADRLMGSEPSTLQGNNVSTKDAAEPPLLTRIGAAHQIAKELTEQVHYHLNRLERL